MPAAALAVRVSAQISEFQKAFTEATRTAKSFEKDFGTMAQSVQKHQDQLNRTFAQFSGDKLTAEAVTLTQAIAKVGGASKLTEAEMARVNATLVEAIAKYQALGQVAPKAMVDLEVATRKAAVATEPLAKTTSLFGQSIAGLEKQSSLGAKAMGALTGTFGQFTAAGIAVTIVSKLTAELGRMVDQGTKLGPVQQSFERLSASVGQESGAMLSSLRTATQGLVSNYDLMLSANKAVLLGLPVTSQSMGELATTARALGKAMGLDATQSLNDLITALGRSSPLILDNLGLTVSVAEANEKYAAKLGKTAEALTDAERKQAFFTEAMEKARQKQSELGPPTLTLGEQVTRVWTGISNVVVSAVSVVNTETGKLISDMERAVVSTGNFLTNLRNQGWRGIFGGLVTSAQTTGGFRPAPAPAPVPVVPPDAVAELKRVTDQVNALTGAQLANLSASKALGRSTEDQIKAFKTLFPNVALTAAHLKVLEDRTRASTRATKDAAEVARDLVRRVNEREQAEHKVTVAMAKSMVGLQAYVVAHRRGLDILTDFIPALHSSGQRAAWVATQFDLLNDRLKISAKIMSDDFKRAQQEAARVLDIAAQRIAAQERALGDLGRALSGLGGLVSGGLGGLVSGAGGVISSFAAMGQSAADFGKIANATFKQTAAFAIEQFTMVLGIVQTVAAYIERNRLTSQRRDFLAEQGGRPAVQTRGLTAGIGTDLLLGTQSASAFASEMERFNRAVAEADARLARYGLTWRDLGQTIRQANIDQIARDLVKDMKALERAGANATDAMADGFSQLVIDAKKTGTKIPVALQPMLETLIRSKKLSEEAARALLGMAEDSTPAFRDVEEAAKRYGIELDKLGPKVAQIGLTEAAEQLAKDFNLFALAGADMNAVLVGMQKSVQEVVNKALLLGLEIPESMRPLLQAMVDAGLLTDLAGVKLTDLSSIKFTVPLTEAIDKLIEKLDELIDHFSTVGTAAEEGFGRARGAAERTGTAVPRGTPTGTTPPDGRTPTGAAGTASVTVNTYLDGEVIARSTAKRLPGVLRSMGV